MSIPDFQKIMLPALKFVAEKKSAKSSEVFPPIKEFFKLTEEEKIALLPSGKQKVIENRTQWALFYLFKAGLLNRPKRGFYIITDEGKNVINSGVNAINLELLNKYESFREFRALRREEKTDIETDKTLEGNENPEEALERNFEAYKSAIISDLLNKIRSIDPNNFEWLVISLLQKMGYGNGPEGVLHLGKSGDGGVDGVINQDILGLEKIFIQVKRYDENNQVGSSAIREFVGSIDGKKSNKGIFITSSTFSKAARDFVKETGKVVRLIDGLELAELLYQYNVGVEEKLSYSLKIISEEYFENL